ncbi:N-acetylmuramoyl-L-alanine amidase family protein [Intestinibaculum porci]|uniref:N-acetylmuramoyl-L-alanine amidase family protein n=1 Tax=Intestinibaculum porci TaxID=2487118 RepID=UPI00240A9523|nr:N-acetylmuramoyl-L-alanine amidase [Intestinibaculum porci]MDD6349392.1 N-acetylmuramoyl-L-alanine amidase [Intestinibaculum porci]
MNSNKIGKSVCGLLLCTLMISGCSAERKTGHETTANDQDKTIVQKSKETDSSKTVEKDTADEQTATNKQDKTDTKQTTSNRTVKTQNKEAAKNDTNTNVKVNTNSNTNTKETGRTICIDAGHQRYGNNALEAIGPGSSTRKPKVTSGTVGKYTNKAESEVNLETAKKLKSILISRGYKVVMVRESQDVNISNIQRAEIANKSNADLAIRIHCDGSGNSALQGYFILTPSSSNRFLSSSIVNSSLRLTKCLLPAIQKATGANNRGISYRDDLTGTNWSKVPTVLVEMGEMSNKQEDYALSTPAYQEKMATGMANGIDDYFQ